MSYKSPTPAIKDVKVVGTIDLDAINQRTRPPEEKQTRKKRDKRELKKKSLVPPKSTDDIVIKKNIVINEGEKIQMNWKLVKEKTYSEKDEKINIEAFLKPPSKRKVRRK